MNRPTLEVGDVIRKYTPAFLDRYDGVLSIDQRRVLEDLALCRTAALGGHVEECDQCGQRRIAYNSCRNRHCPKCQAMARARWMAERAKELLPVEYFHVVFTLPDDLAPIGLQNPRLVYNLLFRAAAQTMLQLAADPKHLGANIGFLAVLHTWGQNLHLHPHLHCVVPGGGIALDGSRWVPCRPGFFLPVRVLSRLFRGKFLAGFHAAFQREQVRLHGQLAGLADAKAFQDLLDKLYAKEWVVYAKRPFGGPEQVLKYLARYTHRVAISNHRLLKLEDDKVFFHYKDYADDSAQKVMGLDAVEFIRRFLQHVVPSGFVRIRHFGFLANRFRAERLKRCRQLIQDADASQVPASPSQEQATETGAESPSEHQRCPHCGAGRMIIVERFERARVQPTRCGATAGLEDSS
ncbi:MAG: IS91 family transposase [Verrucomicrobiales bacterium]|nr:IS91 family transposase [Verrucomicrobiales bacterium]